MVNKLISGKMPGGFGKAAVAARLRDGWGLAPGRVDGVLLHALTMPPPARLGGPPLYMAPRPKRGGDRPGAASYIAPLNA